MILYNLKGYNLFLTLDLAFSRSIFCLNRSLKNKKKKRRKKKMFTTCSPNRNPHTRWCRCQKATFMSSGCSDTGSLLLKVFLPQMLWKSWSWMTETLSSPLFSETRHFTQSHISPGSLGHRWDGIQEGVTVEGSAEAPAPCLPEYTN